MGVSAVQKLADFFEKKYKDKLLIRATKGKDHIVIDFKDLIKHNIDLGSELLDNPSETLKAAKIASEQVSAGKPVECRFKNIPKSQKVPIPNLRAKHLNKFLRIEGIVRQKSFVKPKVTSALFECPDCGNTITILQQDDSKFLEPTRCSCGRRGKFRLNSTEKVDVFSILLEEPTDDYVGGSRLSNIKVMCKADLTDSKIERIVFQGGRVEVIGTLVERQVVNSKGTMTPHIDWYLDANYIRFVDEAAINVKWSEEDVEQFKEFAQTNNWLEKMRQVIFKDVVGNEEECNSAILHMFGGVTKTRFGANKRGDFHILYIGNPGTSKTQILKISQSMVPKGMFGSGVGFSKAGFTAAVVKDELLGGFVADAGLLVLMNGGHAYVDETDKIDKEDLKGLQETLSDQTVTLHKAGIHAKLLARTSVMAAGNPRGSEFSKFNSVYSQIDLEKSLLDRFDLIYPIWDSADCGDDDEIIAFKTGERGLEQDVEFKTDVDFFKKYIAYARAKCSPALSPEINRLQAKGYRNLRQQIRDAEARGTIFEFKVTARFPERVIRISEAVARSRLHKEITTEDYEIANAMLLESMKRVGLDPEVHGWVEEIQLADGTKTKKKHISVKDIRERIIAIIKNQPTKTIKQTELGAILDSDGFDVTDYEKAIRFMNINEGILLNIPSDSWRLNL